MLAEVEQRFYTLEEVAKILNIKRPQVYALVRGGDLPAIKLGGRGIWRVEREHLEAYIARLYEETRAWTQAHPLRGEDREFDEELAGDLEGGRVRGGVG